MTTIRDRLLSLPKHSTEPIEGAGEDEIRNLESYAGHRLPKAYTEFLALMGRSAGELLRGSQYSTTQEFQLRLKESAEDILRRNDAPFRLPEDAFVFLMSPGGQFAYFLADEGDDPAVYYYGEGDSTQTMLNTTLSGYFLKCIQDCESRMTKSTS